MKRNYLYLTLIAFASFSLAACDDEKNGIEEESEITGTWVGEGDPHHYPIAVINADGTYEWEWAGIARFKDVGKYTYEGNKIVMNATTYYEWDEEKDKYVVNKYIEGNIPRKIKILDLTPGMMRISLTDYFMGGGQGQGFDFMLFRKGFVQDIKSKDLEGTWESYDSLGVLTERVIINGSNYTAYEVWYVDSTTLDVTKYTGTWSIKSSILSIKPTALYFSKDIPDGQHEYVYSPVDPVTLEAETWAQASYSLDEYDVKIYLTDDKKTLYAKGAVFKKK